MAERRINQDGLLRVTALLPNAANTVNSNVIDLGAQAPFSLEKVQVRLTSTAATGANNKNISVVLQHSAESNANFTNIPELAAPLLLLTDNNNGGYPAGEALAVLPPSTKRYLRASATGQAAGGNAGDGSVTVALLF